MEFCVYSRIYLGLRALGLACGVFWPEDPVVEVPRDKKIEDLKTWRGTTALNRNNTVLSNVQGMLIRTPKIHFCDYMPLNVLLAFTGQMNPHSCRRCPQTTASWLSLSLSCCINHWTASLAMKLLRWTRPIELRSDTSKPVCGCCIFLATSNIW